MAELSGTELDTWLEQVITARLAGNAAVVNIHRSRFPHIGSYDCDAVTATFSDGRTAKLFLKDFARSRQTKDRVELRRNRELEVYRQLLDAEALGTPGFYGSQWDEERGRFWMLLELVNGQAVKQLDERDGIPAVRWLADFQAYFQTHAATLAQADFLIEHDVAYFRAKSDDSRRDVAQLAPELQTRLDGVLSVYDTAILAAAREPVCLVHGGFIPWHIFVDRSTSPIRVAVVDWELAARGSLLYDLAIFVDEATPQVRASLIDAWRGRALELGLSIPDAGTTLATIEAFRLHRVIDWLSRSAEKSFTPRKLASLLKLAEAGCKRLVAGG